ncbi:MAG: NAD(P)/FAD-dependent oxidoreductase [Candidatus Zixiibacteriota bacterium]
MTESKRSGKYQVLIIGGGFGGMYAAKKLRNKEVNVTLIDRRNFHLFQPLLYQVATGGLSPGDIASPLRVIFNKNKNITIVKDEVVDFEPSSNSVITKRERIHYDALVLAAGSEHHYFGNNHWAEFAPGLKSIEDAIEIRRRIFEAFELAEMETDPKRQQELMTFLVIGGGPTGVELAGSIGELAHRTLIRDFRTIHTSRAKILLVEGGQGIMPSYPEKLSFRAVQSLNRLGVDVLTSCRVVDIDEHGVVIEEDNRTYNLSAHTVLWAAGVKSSELGKKLAKKTGAETDRSGRIMVGNDLTLPGHNNIYVIGDLAHVKATDGRPLLGVAPVAMQQGRYVAKSILRKLRNKKTRPFHYHNHGNLAVIGRNFALADFTWFRLSGFAAWLVWIFVHIAYLIEFDNKLLVLVQWAGDYFTRKKGARLITNEGRK